MNLCKKHHRKHSKTKKNFKADNTFITNLSSKHPRAQLYPIIPIVKCKCDESPYWILSIQETNSKAELVGAWHWT